MPQPETKNWIAKYYDKRNNLLHTEKFTDRTEHEANNEANGLMPVNCNDWSLTPNPEPFMKISQTQYDLLKHKIYMTLMDGYNNEGEELGMGEMGDCDLAAQELVDSWLKETGIEIDF